jgi:hypothetical protein
MSDSRFYLKIECPRCDADVFLGPCMTLIAHRGLPVVPADTASQATLDCDECGLEFFTGDLETDYDEGQRDCRDGETDEDGELDD